MRLLLVLAALLVATPGNAQTRATFIKGTFVESAEACERHKDIKAGKPGVSPLAAPALLSATGMTDGADSRCRFKSIAVMRPGVRWRVVMACIDDGVPIETTAEISKKGKDRLVIFQREVAMFWPAELGRGVPVPGRPNVTVVRQTVTETETWLRCDA